MWLRRLAALAFLLLLQGPKGKEPPDDRDPHASNTLVAVAAPAIAQDRPQPHDVYPNRDGKAFTLERSFATLAACDAAAKSLYESKRVLGADANRRSRLLPPRFRAGGPPS